MVYQHMIALNIFYKENQFSVKYYKKKYGVNQ